MELQKKLSLRVVKEDKLRYEEIEKVCGVDVSYRKNTAYCSALIINRHNWEVVEVANMSIQSPQPYFPGLFMIREARPVLTTLKQLKKKIDLLLIDGHGVLHPRRCGLACYIGITINKPTIGVGKRLLCGSVRKDQFIERDGEIIGFKVNNTRNDKKSVYVSVGNLISLVTSIRLIQDLTKDEHWIPEPLRLADLNSKNELNFEGASNVVNPEDAWPTDWTL
jgi:deoxyribonuclease V